MAIVVCKTEVQPSSEMISNMIRSAERNESYDQTCGFSQTRGARKFHCIGEARYSPWHCALPAAVPSLQK